MGEFKIIFLSLFLLVAAVADEAEEEKAPKSILFSLASARAEGRELTKVEMLVDAYINLLDIMSKDDDAPYKYDEEDVLRQFSEYDNPFVADIIKAFNDDKPTEEGTQDAARLSKILESHFEAQGFTPEEHRYLLDRHELFGKVSKRLTPPKKSYHQGQTAFGNPGHLGGEL